MQPAGIGICRETMRNRALEVLACLAIGAALSAPAVSAYSQTVQDGNAVRPAGGGSDADNSANLLQSALGVQPALIVPADASAPGQVTTGEFTSEAPADVAETDVPSPNPKALLELPDLNNIQGIPRLPFQKMPTYSVLGSHVPEFRERDVYTKEGMEALSFKRHPGLVVGNQFNLNKDAAYEMFLEEDWRNTKSDYWNMARAMAMGGDPGEGHLILKDVIAADLSVRAEAESEADQPALGQFRLGELGGDSRLLDVSAIPFDLTVVRVKW